MRSDAFKNVIIKMEAKPNQTKPIYLLINHVYLYSYLVLKNLPRLILHKTQQTK